MQSGRHFVRYFLTSVTWWLGLAISLVLFQLASQLTEEKNAAKFDFRTNIARQAIEARIRSHIEVLRATRAMFQANGTVSRDAFHVYVTDLALRESFPGIAHLDFATHVRDSDKAAFEESVRAERDAGDNGFAGFAINPPGLRSEYHVLTYLAPMRHNADRLGIDLASDPKVDAALAMSRDSGELISLVRPAEPGDQGRIAGLEMRMPLYRPGYPLASVAQRQAAYYGSVGAEFDIDKLMLDTVDRSALPDLRLRLYDLGRSEEYIPQGMFDPAYLLFDSMEVRGQGRSGSAGSGEKFFVKESLMSVGSHVWEIEFSTPREAMLTGFYPYIPWMVLIAALVGTLLIYGSYYSLLTARSRAVEIARDMTKDLRASKAELAEAQQMAMLGSWLLDPDTGSMTWSDETYSIFGAVHFGSTPEYEGFLAHADEPDRELIRQGLATALRTGSEFNTEFRIVRPDGSVRWGQMIARPSHNGRKRLLRGTIMDITERKHNLEALKRSQELLRELTAHQDRIREDERKRIAREIHDELGQTLLALRLDVSMLDARTAKSHPKLNERVRSMLHHLDATVKTVRTIINNLRPAVLDLGLSAAVEWQVKEFRRRSAIGCDLVMDSHDLRLGDERATMLFRILQESLTNVIRHASATRVRIELYEDGSQLVMKIADNGVGIDPSDRNKAESFGLVGIEERVLALDGEFRLDSAPGKGTVLSIVIPLDPADSDRADMACA